MKSSTKFFIVLASIPALLLIFFASNIKGYYRFKSYCSNEGGLKVNELLERNVGWSAKDYNDAHTAAQLNGVGFVRYTDKKDGKTYDLRYLGGDPQYEKSFEKNQANEAYEVFYKWAYISGFVNDEIRLGKYGYRVYDIKTNKVLVEYQMFSFSKFKRENTILGAPSGVSCFDDVNSNGFSRWHEELNTVFKK